MERAAAKKTRQMSLKILASRLNPKEMKALKASLKILNEQANRLGLLDSMEIEPAMIYFAEGGKR